MQIKGQKKSQIPSKTPPPRPPKIRLRYRFDLNVNVRTTFLGCVKFLHFFFLLQIYNADGESSAGDRFTDIVCDSGLLTPQ